MTRKEIRSDAIILPDVQTQPTQFRLLGSMRPGVDEDELDAWLDQNRKAQAERAALKLADL